MSNNLFEIPLKTIEGAPSSLAEFRGKVLLVVNVASKCGLTPQYEGLETLYEERRARGLEILGFPANDFGAQEPGTHEEIVAFCQRNYGVTFPLFEKISVKGDAQHPLYATLTTAQPRALETHGSKFRDKLATFGIKQDKESDVLWNFEKFLIARDGSVVARFSPDTVATDEALLSAIDAELAK